MELFDLQHEVVTAKRTEYFRRVRTEFVARNPELALINESPLAHHEAVATIDGATFSAKLEQTLNYYEDIKAGVDDVNEIKVIVEVGSGFGRLARLMHLLDRSRCYVLVDLPESLVFAYAFLRTSFPESRIKVLANADDIVPGMTQHFDFIFCPIHQLVHLKLDRVDLFVNTYSFAEMTQGCVNHILDCVERVLKPRFLYSLNLVFADKTIHFDTGGLDGEGNETVLALQPEWWPKRFVLIPGVVDTKYRVTGSVVLQHVTTLPQLLIRELRAAEEAERDPQKRLGYLYLSALWSRDQDLADKFFQDLRRLFGEFGFTPAQGYHFDKIGEVLVLRRGIAFGSPAEIQGGSDGKKDEKT